MHPACALYCFRNQALQKGQSSALSQRRALTGLFSIRRDLGEMPRIPNITIEVFFLPEPAFSAK
jgi:hypothetical protein